MCDNILLGTFEDSRIFYLHFRIKLSFATIVTQLPYAYGDETYVLWDTRKWIKFS